MAFSPEHMQGLTQKDAKERLVRDGPNELPSQKKQSFWQLFFAVLREPMLLLLLGSGGIYVLLGDPQDAYLLLASVFVIIGITIYQERKTAHALESLRSLSSPRALVIRDGHPVRISGKEVVVGDILILHEGDRISADARILRSTSLFVDEASLTGESFPVRKTAWDGKKALDRPGGEDLPFVFAGTLVTGGKALAEVIAIGVHTEIGKIGKSLRVIEEEDTPLKKEVRRVVERFAFSGLILCGIVFLTYGVSRGYWLSGLLAGLTLAMAILPEEFSVIFVVFLALGAWRIARKNVLTRKLQSIETLGSATVLCVDKTGTLTLNRVVCEGEKEALEYALLASEQKPFDPMERAIYKRTQEKSEQFLRKVKNWQLVREYPLSHTQLSMSNIWSQGDGKEYIASAKGAPEAIFALCRLPEARFQALKKEVDRMSASGLRLLAVAKARLKTTTLPNVQQDIPFEFVGFLKFIDPIRETAKDAIQECYRAGVRVMMVTGDYPGTAVSAAKMIGLANADVYLTGQDLNRMDSEELRKKLESVNIFARILPEQKLAIVNGLKANGDIVAMTGDGVNDAPALTTSHIGIAMGLRGTDVARESADLVLLTDDFSSIVHAIRLGRKIFDNLKKAVSYILAVHIPIIGMSLIPLIFRLPIVLLPAHIAFLEFIIDPACSIVFESEKGEEHVMDRPPRKLHDPLFGKATILLSMVQGVSMFFIVLIVFFLSLYWGFTGEQTRSLTFITIVFGNLILILTNISRTSSVLALFQHKNKALWIVLLLALVSLLAIFSLPFLRSLFHFSLFPMQYLLIAVTLTISSFLWLEAVERIVVRKEQ